MIIAGRLPSVLVPCHHHAADPERGRRGAIAQRQVLADAVDGREHLQQVARHRDLLDRVRELAVLELIGAADPGSSMRLVVPTVTPAPSRAAWCVEASPSFRALYVSRREDTSTPSC